MMMSLDSVHKECVEEEEVWSGDYQVEQEVWSSSSNQKCDEIDTTGVGKEATENCEDTVEEPKEGMIFDTSEEAYLYYSRFAKEKGFAVAKRTSRKGKDGKLKDVTIACNRAGKARVTTSNPVKPRPQSKINCPAHVTVVLHSNGKWRLNRVALVHNHDQSPGKARYLKSNRVLDEHVKRRLELNDKAGINLNQTYASLQIEAGGPGKLPYIQKDCRNHVDKVRRSLLVEGDAEAMHNYFMKMKADNSDFFFAMDLDDEGRLRNVFWADGRSRAACKEFGDVVTFDTTYCWAGSPELHKPLNVAKHDATFYATKYGTRRKYLPISSNFLPNRNNLEPIYAFFSRFTELIKWSRLDGSINYCG